MKKDIGSICSDALKDYYNKDYKSAHDKYEWFFENSEKIDPSYSGVRVSFCLAGWADVAREYPEAMLRLIEQKESALKKFNETKSIKYFRDFSCISRYLNTGDEVLDIFFLNHKFNKSLAKDIFKYAYEFLVQKEDWEICAIYMDNYSERYDLSFRVFDRTSTSLDKHCEYDDEMNKFMFQDSANRLKEGLIPLLKISVLASHIISYDQLLENIKLDLEKRDLNDLFVEICNAVPNTTNN